MQPITGKYPLSANNAEPTSHGREAPPPTCSVPVCNDDSIFVKHCGIDLENANLAVPSSAFAQHRIMCVKV